MPSSSPFPLSTAKRKRKGKTIIGGIIPAMSATPAEVTRLLRAWGGGDGAALKQLTPMVYEELHRIAKRYMGRENPGATLQTTAVLNEAYLKLVDVTGV